MNCRHCSAPLAHVVVDLGHQPPSNAYLSTEDLAGSEIYAPLKTFVCDRCWLVQLPAYHQADQLFTKNYAYFSSISTSWVEHARRYVEAMARRFGLGPNSLVVEVASNDGYLLQFVKAGGMRCFGIEPTASTAAVARERGIESLELFFGEQVGRELVAERGHANLMAANNVLAHVPDINDFVAGFREVLAPEGVATFEFPHVMRLVDGCQFDTIYHEHYSYLSLHTVRSVFESQGLLVFDVEEIGTHGGSLRVFACRADSDREEEPAVSELLERERAAGLLTVNYYSALQGKAEQVKLDLLAFLVDQKRAGRQVVAYGAAAKGNTLLNYAGVKPDLLSFVCDAAPSKQGQFMPGSHLPIRSPAAIDEARPDFVLILPWNIASEVTDQLSHIRDWGARCAIAVPRLELLS